MVMFRLICGHVFLFSQKIWESAESPLGGGVCHRIIMEAFSKSSPGNSDLTSALLSSHLKWELLSIFCWRCGPTWYLRTSSCSFKTCISCLVSPKSSTRVLLLLLWGSSCCSASGLPEAEGKQDVGSYPEEWLCDRLAASVGLLLMHDAELWITSSSHEIRNTPEWYLQNMKWNERLITA